MIGFKSLRTIRIHGVTHDANDLYRLGTRVEETVERGRLRTRFGVLSQRRIAKRHEMIMVERMSENADVRLNVSDEPVI